MNLLEELKSFDVNVDEALNRLGGNEAFYTRLLGKFTDTIKNYYIQPDFDCNNCKEITEKAHTIKGITGNLSMTPLYEGYTKIVNLLRAGQSEQAKEILIAILPVQNQIIGCIEKYMN